MAKKPALPAPEKVLSNLAAAVNELNVGVSALACYLDYRFSEQAIEQLHRLADEVMDARRALYTSATRIADLHDRRQRNEASDELWAGIKQRTGGNREAPKRRAMATIVEIDPKTRKAKLPRSAR